jgi:hypothetical protein
MVDVVFADIDAPTRGTGWKQAVRERILSARRSLLRHPWASRVIESRANPTPMLLSYMDSMVGVLRGGGFSVDLTHHAMHALGSRLYGFTQEVFDDSPGADPQERAAAARQMAPEYPHLAELAGAVYHDDASVVGQGCDDQLEFELALDLLLDGLERLLEKSSVSRATRPATVTP